MTMDIDPRGPRFGAVITTVVLAVVLITGSAWLLGAQLLVFAIGALFGLRYAPYGIVYRRLVRPRLGAPAAGIGVTAFALFAAFLNAAFDFCLGCQVYLFIQRNLRVRPSA